jgi:hypothetical protein
MPKEQPAAVDREHVPVHHGGQIDQPAVVVYHKEEPAAENVFQVDEHEVGQDLHDEKPAAEHHVFPVDKVVQNKPTGKNVFLSFSIFNFFFNFFFKFERCFKKLRKTFFNVTGREHILTAVFNLTSVENEAVSAAEELLLKLGIPSGVIVIFLLGLLLVFKFYEHRMGKQEIRRRLRKKFASWSNLLRLPEIGRFFTRFFTFLSCKKPTLSKFFNRSRTFLAPSVTFRFRNLGKRLRKMFPESFLSSSTATESSNITDSTFQRTSDDIPLNDVRVSIEDDYPQTPPPAGSSLLNPPNHTPPTPEIAEHPDQISRAEDLPMLHRLPRSSRVEQQRRQHAEQERELAEARKKNWENFEDFEEPSFSTTSRMTSTPAVKQPRLNPFNIGAEVYEVDEPQEVQHEKVPVEVVAAHFGVSVAEVEQDQPAGTHFFYTNKLSCKMFIIRIIK